MEDVDVLLTLLCGRLAGANGGNVKLSFWRMQHSLLLFRFSCFCLCLIYVSSFPLFRPVWIGQKILALLYYLNICIDKIIGYTLIRMIHRCRPLQS